MGLSELGDQMVIALQDYVPLRDDDLPLQKDQEYRLINSSHSDWWTVQDERGYDSIRQQTSDFFFYFCSFSTTENI